MEGPGHRGLPLVADTEHWVCERPAAMVILNPSDALAMADLQILTSDDRSCTALSKGVRARRECGLSLGTRGFQGEVCHPAALTRKRYNETSYVQDPHVRLICGVAN